MYGSEAKLPSDSWIEDFSRMQGIDIVDYADRLAHALTIVCDTIAMDRADRDRHAEALLQ
jgi:hypothetical protein